MTRCATIFACAVFIAALLPFAEAAGGSVITAEQVATALNQRGMSVSADQLTLLSNAISNTANPDLKVKSIERLDGGREAVRLECARQQQCLPFVVTVRLDSGTQGISEAMSGIQPKAIAVHDGSKATLHLDGAHVHIVLTAICLENGSIGQTIRATSIDRHIVYMVRVADNGLLEGSL
jgi:hypothetical protein